MDISKLNQTELKELQKQLQSFPKGAAEENPNTQDQETNSSISAGGSVRIVTPVSFTALVDEMLKKGGDK